MKHFRSVFWFSKLPRTILKENRPMEQYYIGVQGKRLLKLSSGSKIEIFLYVTIEIYQNTVTPKRISSMGFNLYTEGKKTGYQTSHITTLSSYYLTLNCYVRTKCQVDLSVRNIENLKI